MTRLRERREDRAGTALAAVPAAGASLAHWRGAGRLVFDGVERLTDLVEAMHLNIARRPLLFGRPVTGRTRGITGAVYNCIRAVNNGVREGLDEALARIARDLPALEPAGSSGREAWLAAVNGVLGDYLEASGNGLALPMRLRRNGQPLALSRAELARQLPEAGSRLLLAVHGLCMNDLQWTRAGHNHAEALTTEFGCTPLYLHYNSGRHISVNGRELAALLEALLAEWPVPLESLDVLAHSMGGLVMRSACHYAAQAGHAWPKRLRRIVFLGTPHHGAPLERGGNLLQAAVGITPYSAPLARLGMLRSAGVTDLRYGSLLDEDWQGQDRFRHSGDTRRPLPLPPDVRCYAVAATTARSKGDIRDRLLGDGLVRVGSALGRHRRPEMRLDFAASAQAVFHGLNHWDLLSRAEVHARLGEWFRE